MPTQWAHGPRSKRTRQADHGSDEPHPQRQLPQKPLKDRGHREMINDDHRGTAWLVTREFDTHPSTFTSISSGVIITPVLPRMAKPIIDNPSSLILDHCTINQSQGLRSAYSSPAPADGKAAMQLALSRDR